MLVVLKIKAKQKTEQVWDSVEHFLNYTQDRKAFKEYSDEHIMNSFFNIRQQKSNSRVYWK